MMSRGLGVAWFRFRAGCHIGGGYVSLVLLIGLVGGVANGGGRCSTPTQSSYPAFMRSTNPSDLHVIDLGQWSSGTFAGVPASWPDLPNVKRVASEGFQRHPTGRQMNSPLLQTPTPDAKGVFVIVSYDGLYADQDRVTVVHGRMADPARQDQIVMTGRGSHAGSPAGPQFHLAFTPTTGQFAGVSHGQRPHCSRSNVRLVGIVVFNHEVVQDDTDACRPRAPQPGDRCALAQCAVRWLGAGLQLDHGGRDGAVVEAEIAKAIPTAVVTSVTSQEIAKAERAIEPESIALAVFGGIAAGRCSSAPR